MSGRKKGRSSRRAAIGVLALAAFLALGIIAYKEANDPQLALGEIEIRGQHETTSSQILLAAALEKGSNIWLLDVAAGERRVEALPWIDVARVRRAWPNHVRIEVAERSPVARISLPNGGTAEEPEPAVALVDAALRVLAVRPQGQGAAALPLFRIVPQPVRLDPGSNAAGSDVEHAYDAMVQLRALGLRISEVDLKPATGVTVTCDGGLRVILGSDDDLAKKVNLFKAIMPKIASPRDVVYVDLRSVRAPTVLYR